MVDMIHQEASAELGGAPLALSENALTWIVDPIDGTTNFVHGFPVTCVSIGLARGNEVSSKARADGGWCHVLCSGRCSGFEAVGSKAVGLVAPCLEDDVLLDKSGIVAPMNMLLR